MSAPLVFTPAPTLATIFWECTNVHVRWDIRSKISTRVKTWTSVQPNSISATTRLEPFARIRTVPTSVSAQRAIEQTVQDSRAWVSG